MGAVTRRAKRYAVLGAQSVAPRWNGASSLHPSFAEWMGNPRASEPAVTSRAVKRLRKMSKREYEVLYRIITVGESIDEVRDWLNERAERNSIPLPDGRHRHYSSNDTWVLFIAGVHYIRHCIRHCPVVQR